MSYRNRKPAPAPDLRQAEGEWLDAIEEEYGVRLGPGQLYADQRGQVFAGSEYVARLGSTKGGTYLLDPDLAHTWTSQLGHRPRGTGGRTEVAGRRSA